MKSTRVQFQSTWLADCFIREVENPRRLVLLLHGYLQSGRLAYRNFERFIPEDCLVIAPNAPFPVPMEKTTGHRHGFTWYFYDSVREEFFIDWKIGTEWIASLVDALGFADLPKTIVGFSQGGYMSPFVAKRLSNTDHIVGISCEFLSEAISGPFTFRMDEIHAVDDNIVSYQDAKQNHETLIEAGATGTFITVPSGGHVVTQAVQEHLKQLLTSR